MCRVKPQPGGLFDAGFGSRTKLGPQGERKKEYPLFDSLYRPTLLTSTWGALISVAWPSWHKYWRVASLLRT